MSKVNIKDFFKSPDTLFIHSPFDTHFFSKSHEISPCPGELVKAFTLIDYMSNQDILDDVKKFKFHSGIPITTLSQIKTLIEKQPNGCDGVLLTNGTPNIFFVSVDEALFVVVAVHFDLRSHKFFIGGCSITDGRLWYPGSQFFCNKT